MPVLLLMVSIIVFILGVYGPGDPIEVQLGNNYDEANAERIREKMGLNAVSYTHLRAHET